MWYFCLGGNIETIGDKLYRLSQRIGNELYRYAEFDSSVETASTKTSRYREDKCKATLLGLLQSFATRVECLLTGFDELRLEKVRRARDDLVRLINEMESSDDPLTLLKNKPVLRIFYDLNCHKEIFCGGIRKEIFVADSVSILKERVDQTLSTNAIVALCIELSRHNPRDNVVLVTNDPNLRREASHACIPLQPALYERNPLAKTGQL